MLYDVHTLDGSLFIIILFMGVLYLLACFPVSRSLVINSVAAIALGHMIDMRCSRPPLDPYTLDGKNNFCLKHH